MTRQYGIKPTPVHFSEIKCPCCSSPTKSPSLEMIIDLYRLSPMESAVLTAVWRGRGYEVSAPAIFNVMYADDPDGGPSDSKMYSSLKFVMHKLRKKLSQSGIKINYICQRGYKLELGSK